MDQAPQNMKTPDLLEEYRKVLLQLGQQIASETDPKLARTADLLEAEINRRIAW